MEILKPSNYRPKWVRRQGTDKLFNKIVEENFLQTKEINIHTDTWSTQNIPGKSRTENLHGIPQMKH